MEDYVKLQVLTQCQMHIPKILSLKQLNLQTS
jgi:hypothetical protein